MEIELSITEAERHEPAVLEDPSGRRGRVLRAIGRAIALVFLLWLAVILLGALGVGPSGRIPFGAALKPVAGPAPLRAPPRPRPTAPADLVPALPAVKPAATVSRGGSALAPGQVKKAANPAANGRGSSTTPSKPGKSSTAPGRAKTTTGTTGPASPPRGKSTQAPGRAKKTAVTATTTTATTTAGTTTARGRVTHPPQGRKPVR